MTPGEIIDLVAAAYQSSRNYWASDESRPMDALSIVGALCDAGLCTDDKTGEASLEARVLKVTDKLFYHYDGQYTPEDVGVEVALNLGLVTEAELEGVA